MFKSLTSTVKLNTEFWMGIILFWVMYLIPTPTGMSVPAQKTAAITLLMVCWWMSEAIPIPVTALVPLAAFPICSIMNSKTVAAPYANHNVFLFLGGFCMAIAMQKWNLHKRIALYIIRLIGQNQKQLVMGFMVATAFLSMWISNTATTMMMLPIALAITSHFHKNDSVSSNFSTVLLLSIAYSASIGGIGTLIGTPPNIVLAGQMNILFPEIPEIGFFQWMKVGLPLVIIFLPLVWWYLTSVAIPLKQEPIDDAGGVINEEISKMGKIKKEEALVLTVFVTTCLGWIFRKTIIIGPFTIPGWSDLLGISQYVHDSTVAIVAALILFMIPVDLKQRRYLLDWESARKMPWGILLLFGGGFALAKGFEVSGLSLWIGESLRGFSALPVILMIAVTCIIITFLTEVTSNTATATMILPVLAAMSVGMGMHPLLLMLPATLSASCAFMLPIATPPNAIVFGSGKIPIRMMAKTGLVLNFAGIFLVTFLVYFISFKIFDIALR